MRKIIFTRPDGGLSVVHPVRNSMGEDFMEDLDIEKRAWDKLPSDAINPHYVEASEIPADRTFRDAWQAEGGTITHNMDKCREIHKNRLRKLRSPILFALDIEYQRADEEGNVTRKKDIASKKKTLRDVTDDPRITAAKTPDELKSIIPEILK